MPKSLDVFDYLKVADKEDIYTALLYYAFTESAVFRVRFCAFFGVEDDPHAKLLLRYPFIYESKIIQRIVNKDQKIVEESHRHQRQIPDLTLLTQTKICLIESKLFTGEGSFQTERYGDQSFLDSIKKNKKVLSHHVEEAILYPHRSKNLQNQCLFYMTINGDRANNENFKSITWSDLITSVFADFYEHSEILQPILTQMALRFISYPQLKTEVIAARAHMGINAFLKNSNKHFLLSKEYLFYAYFDEFKPIKEIMHDREGFQIDAMTLSSTQQILITCENWCSESIASVLERVPLGTSVDEVLERSICKPYPFAQIKIRIFNNKKIAVCINYEPHPYLSEKKIIRKYGNKIAQRLKEGKNHFEEELKKRGILPSSYLLQVTKTEFIKQDQELVNKVLEQVKTYIKLIDELTSIETTKEQTHE